MAETTPPPVKDHGRAGRNLPAAVASAVVLLVAIAASLFFFKSIFMVIVMDGLFAMFFAAVDY